MTPRSFRGILCALAAIVSSSVAGAPLRGVVSTPQPTRQAAPPGVATFGLPSPSGLTPPAPATLTPGAAPGSPVTDPGVQQPLAPAGGGGGVVVLVQQAAGGANAMGAGASPRAGYSTVEITRAFFDADTNHDGELSRAEAQRLAIPLGPGFDELDRNHDGVLSRFEYEDAFR
jgi:hypothetical protein